MEKIRNVADFTDHHIEKKRNLDESRQFSRIKIGICLLLYFTVIFLQVRFSSFSNIAGVVAQLQVMISVCLVVIAKEKGYRIGVAINLLASAFVGIIIVLGAGNLKAIPGIMVPLSTIIIISIISFYGKRVDSNLAEVAAQKKELSVLYDELANSEKEVLEQNQKLRELNRKMKQREVRLNYLAYTDVLTGLPNREMLVNKLDYLVEQSQEKQAPFAVVFIDLDSFKKINDYKGHHIGDLLLKSIADRIKKIVLQQDMLGRLGGDEFTLIIQRDLSETEIFEYVEKIRMALLETFVVENMNLNISASFGIARYPRDGVTATELLNYSDIAMYKAKEFGKNRVQFINGQA